MNSRDEQLIAALNDAVVVLRTSGFDSWAQVLTRLKHDYMTQQTPSNRCNIRRLFGGPGTLNDLVLSRDRVPLFDENEILDSCRTKIWELAQEYPEYG